MANRKKAGKTGPTARAKKGAASKGAATKRATKKGGAAKTQRGQKIWSQQVTSESDALDLKGGVFAQKSPRKVAESLKRSAEASTRKKGTPYQSAMSMLTFFMNRAGKQLSAQRKRVLERAKC